MILVSPEMRVLSSLRQSQLQLQHRYLINGYYVHQPVRGFHKKGFRGRSEMKGNLIFATVLGVVSGKSLYNRLFEL